mgnify:CR=1 FL=1
MKRAPNLLRRLSKTTTRPTLWSVVVPNDNEKKEATTTTQTERALQTRSGARAPVPTKPIETICSAVTPCDNSSLLSMSTVSTGTTRQSRVCESSLNPYSGALKCCINCNISHLPTKCRSAKDYCQLHYWCTTKRITFSCAFCYNCNVVLCMDCYETFHSVWDLQEKKAELKEKMSKT